MARVGEQRAKSRTRRQTGVNAPVKLALPARRHTGHRRPPPQADESPSDIRASARDAQASAFRPSRDRDRCARELRSTVTRSRKKRSIPRLFAVSRFRSPSEFPHVSLIHAPGRSDGKLSTACKGALPYWDTDTMVRFTSPLSTNNTIACTIGGHDVHA